MTRLQEAVLEVLALGPGLNLAPDAQAKFEELGAAWMEEVDGLRDNSCQRPRM